MKKLVLISLLSGIFLLAHVQTQAQTGTTSTPTSPKSWWNNIKSAYKAKKDSLLALKKDTTHKHGLISQLAPSQNNTVLTGNGNNNSTDAVAIQLDACTGNAAAQTVTIFFTIANPASVNQAIAIGLGQYAKAIDPDGNLSRARECHLADGNGAGWTELPTGLKMKGSITFTNILPKQAQLALMEFNIFSHNADGGRDPKVKNISAKNLAITWQ